MGCSPFLGRCRRYIFTSESNLRVKESCKNGPGGEVDTSSFFSDFALEVDGFGRDTTVLPGTAARWERGVLGTSSIFLVVHAIISNQLERNKSNLADYKTSWWIRRCISGLGYKYNQETTASPDAIRSQDCLRSRILG